MTLFNDESEKAVLSILIKYPNTYYQAVGLTDEMFSSVPHQLLFRAIRELNDQNLTLDSNLLVEYLKSKGTLNEAGGIEYLNFLVAKDYKETNLPQYMTIVLESYRGRVLISTANQIPGRITNTEDVPAAIEYLRDVINNL